MFKDVRNKKREITHEESIEILQNGEYGVLSTINSNGYAYGVPLSYVFMDSNIYFHCALEGQKLENIKNNNKVSFCVVGKTELLPEQFSTKYESTIAFGTAIEVEGEEKEKALIAIIEKYSKDYIGEGKKYIEAAKGKTNIVRINIEHVSGKARR